MRDKISTFQALHQSGCFVLPNPWDVGSAVALASLGYKALATTSAGLAFTRGLPDTVSSLSRDVVLENIREIANATPLPLNADFQSGYAEDPEGVAANVALCVGTGAAGLSIEDASGDRARPLYDQARAVERICAARMAIDATGLSVVLTARCEAFLVGDPEPTRTVIDRLTAFAEAGADCLYAPGVRDPATIRTIVKSVAPKAVNVLISSPRMTVTELADFGVRRVSVGSALARVAWGAFLRAARDIQATGCFESLADAAVFAELNQIFTPSA